MQGYRNLNIGVQKLCAPITGVLTGHCSIGRQCKVIETLISVVKCDNTQGQAKSWTSFARQVYDSCGHTTVDVDLITDEGLFRPSVPSGTSVGLHESLELRDNDSSEFHGKGVKKAVEVVNKVIAPELTKHRGFRLTWQSDLDEFLVGYDGTNTRSRLGANAMLAVLMALLSRLDQA